MARTANDIAYSSNLNAIAYGHLVVEDRNSPVEDGSMRYATRAMGIADKATLSAWIINRSTYERQVQ